jgi:hypothetical protein
MNKNSLGELKLSPIKENGKFVFINSEIRVNGKLNKGDSIKIFVDSYEEKGGQYIVKGPSNPSSKMVVRGIPLIFEHPDDVYSVEELYDKVGEMYKNQFYFGKVEI